MSTPYHTFELTIDFKDFLKPQDAKNRVIDFLIANGVDTFVEGAIDGLDVDHVFDEIPGRDFYEEFGGQATNISIYSFDQDELLVLQKKLTDAFGSLQTTIKTIVTEDWTEGWKESFTPIITDRFFIHPPWNKEGLTEDKIPLEIDPGMAFGTGQHATTQLCLKLLEKINVKDQRVADIGTGSGILSIACRKLGFKSIAACDIDINSVIAFERNAEANAETTTRTSDDKSINPNEMIVWQGSTEKCSSDTYDLVIANILQVVLVKLLPDLVKCMRPKAQIIFSGLLVEQGEEFTKLAAEYGLSLKEKIDSEGWLALLCEKI